MIKPITLRLTPELHEAIRRSAQTNHRSLNAEILFALAHYLANQ